MAAAGVAGNGMAAGRQALVCLYFPLLTPTRQEEEAATPGHTLPQPSWCYKQWRRDGGRQHMYFTAAAVT